MFPAHGTIRTPAPLALWPGLIALLLLIPNSAPAQTPIGKVFGFGFSIGEPTAVTVKFRTGRSSAMDISAGKSALGYPSVRIDYLWQFTNLISSPSWSGYTGIGLAVGFDKKGEYFVFRKHADSSHWFMTKDPVGAGRLLLGIDYLPRYAPIELYAELCPLIAFYPKTALDIEGAIGIRFYP